VYEDADYEDLSFAEMRRVLWSGSTPTAKREACTKHAKLLGIVTDEQCSAMAAQGAAAPGQGGKNPTPFLQSGKGGVMSSTTAKGSAGDVAATSSSSSSGSSSSGNGTHSGGSQPVAADKTVLGASTAVRGVSAALAVATISDTSSNSSAGGSASDNDSSRDSNEVTAAEQAAALEAVVPAVAAPVAPTKSTSSLTSLSPVLSQQIAVPVASSSSSAAQGSCAPASVSAPSAPAADSSAAAGKPVGVPRLLELQQIARMHHPAPSLSAVSSASKEKPKSLSRPQLSQTAGPPLSQPTSQQQVPPSQVRAL
jgi:hypothetical protein